MSRLRVRHEGVWDAPRAGESDASNLTCGRSVGIGPLLHPGDETSYGNASYKPLALLCFYFLGDGGEEIPASFIEVHNLSASRPTTLCRVPCFHSWVVKSS